MATAAMADDEATTDGRWWRQQECGGARRLTWGSSTMAGRVGGQQRPEAAVGGASKVGHGGCNGCGARGRPIGLLLAMATIAEQLVAVDSKLKGGSDEG